MRRILPLLAVSAALTGCDQADAYMAERRAQEHVAEALRDPGSAEFRKVHSFAVDGSRIVCGHVNGNNAYGGKAGFQWFIYADPLFRVSSDERSSTVIAQCCHHLSTTGTTGNATSTLEIEACAGVAPVLPL